MGGAWLSLHLWEHYAFSLDKTFPERRAYPLLKSCSEFLLDWLVEDGKCHPVTNPSTSRSITSLPHQVKKHVYSVTYASAIDMAIIREVFSAVTLAAQRLGNMDDHFLGRVRDAQQRLLSPKIGESGLLLEWVGNGHELAYLQRSMATQRSITGTCLAFFQATPSRLTAVLSCAKPLFRASLREEKRDQDGQ